MEICAVCNVKASQKCAGCNLIFYCSREHQIFDWKNGHKKKCKYFDVSKCSSVKIFYKKLILIYRSKAMTEWENL